MHSLLRNNILVSSLEFLFCRACLKVFNYISKILHNTATKCPCKAAIHNRDVSLILGRLGIYTSCVCLSVCLRTLKEGAVIHLYLRGGAVWRNSNAYAAPSALSRLEVQCFLMTKYWVAEGGAEECVYVCVSVCLSEWECKCEIERNKGRRREKNISKVRSSGRP